MTPSFARYAALLAGALGADADGELPRADRAPAAEDETRRAIAAAAQDAARRLRRPAPGAATGRPAVRGGAYAAAAQAAQPAPAPRGPADARLDRRG